jgi:flagellar hook protein FlgE
MLLSLDSSVSALDQFQQGLDVIGNNIANVNTVGFKSSTSNFEDTFSQTVGSNSTGPMQVGTGVATSSITTDFTEGSITGTGVPTDMAIDDQSGGSSSFFLVKDPSTGAEYATRDGEFSVDNSGYLTTSSGMRVQGYTDAGLTTMGDVQINNTGAPNGDTSPVASYTFSSNGTVSVQLDDGTDFTRGQILLQSFTEPSQLTKVGDNLYTGLTAAGPLATPSVAGTNGLGTIVTGSLEMSNVDLAGQMTDLITVQRAYEANTKVVTTSDEILQDLINMKR